MEQIFGMETAVVLRNYIERVEVRRNQRIVEAGERAHVLYLLQTGEWFVIMCLDRRKWIFFLV